MSLNILVGINMIKSLAMPFRRTHEIMVLITYYMHLAIGSLSSHAPNWFLSPLPLQETETYCSIPRANTVTE